MKTGTSPSAHGLRGAVTRARRPEGEWGAAALLALAAAGWRRSNFSTWGATQDPWRHARQR